MISIIIPLYNQADKIEKCLQSIAAQTYVNYEIIVVNDKSRDSLSGIIKQSKKDFGIKIEWLHNQENHGAPYTRNKGFRKARGEYLLFCDADVILREDALALMVAALKNNPTASYAYPSFKFGHKLFKLWDFDADKLRQMPYIHSTALIRREHYPEKGWDESLKKLQDWDLWLTMLDAGHEGVWIPDVLFQVDGGGHTMSSWLPSFAYKLFPFLPSVKKYRKAMEIVKKKHKTCNMKHIAYNI